MSASRDRSSAVLLGKLLDCPFQARLPLLHSVHVAVLFLETKVFRDVLALPLQPATQLCHLPRCGMRRLLLQFMQVFQEYRVGSFEDLGNRGLVVGQVSTRSI